jgi:competence protein ComEC
MKYGILKITGYALYDEKGEIIMKKLWKKAGALLLAALLPLALVLPAGAAGKGAFQDVQSGDWFHEAVTYAVEEGLFSGTSQTTFSPDGSMERGMVVTVLGRKSNVIKEEYPGTRFSDVQAGKYYAPYVEWAATYDIVGGVSATRFAPSSEVTREQLVTMLYRYAQKTGNDTSKNADALSVFPDKSQVSSWAVESMQWAVTHGVISGSGGKLQPKKTATRAQVAQIFYNSRDVLVSDTLPERPTESSFSVQFIDVGQADAALVQCDGKFMLIDGGNAADSSKIYSVLQKNGANTLEYVVATHEHEDHVGGLAGALSYAKAKTILCPVTQGDSKAFQNFKAKADANGGITVPKTGAIYTLGSATMQIVAVNAGEGNDSSIMLRIQYGKNAFLFTGDGERAAEQAALSSGYNLQADVLKVGHHGSDTSTSYLFLREVMPKIAVLSVGENNAYGHPDEAVLSRLRDCEAKLYRTDMQGDIIIRSDKTNLTVTTDKNQDIETNPTEPDGGDITYIGNINSHVFHLPSCSSLPKEENRVYFSSREEAIQAGMTPCKRCNP